MSRDQNEQNTAISTATIPQNKFDLFDKLRLDNAQLFAIIRIRSEGGGNYAYY